MNGFLNVKKPLGFTSSDAVLYVRKRLPRGTAVGHGGTLDPEASGVLPICVGAATRLFDYLADKKKTYAAVLRLGFETDTQDATGAVLREMPVAIGEAEIRSALPGFIGETLQTPPMYSAIKVGGKRLYQMARKGESIEVAARKCVIDDIRFMGAAGENAYALEIDCGRGVYIRTLCQDIARAAGCMGHMASLSRRRCGPFLLESALSLEDVDRLSAEGALEDALLPMDYPLSHLPAVRVLGERAAHAVRNGNILKSEWFESAIEPGAGAVRIYLEDRFAGVGETLPEGGVRFRAMLLKENA